MKKYLFTFAVALPLAAMGCKKEQSPEPSPDQSAETAAAKPAEGHAEPAKNAETAAVADEAKKADPHDVEGVQGKLSPDQVEELLAKKEIHVYDANSEKTRKEHGVVPGAKLLPSYKNYELSLLPEQKDAKLVFYCSNLQCGAAGKGAERAVVAGYTDVNLMPVGIMGWKDAGKKIQKL